MTVTEEILAPLVDWFGRVKLASLELPDGWFGRPYDNLHQLTWSAATSHKLLLELDHQLLLVITDPRGMDVNESEVRLNGCLQVTLDWQEFGNMRPHVDDHGQGTVRLAAHGAALRH